MSLQWDNTDQFGNLKVAISDASDAETFESHVQDMIARVREQHGDAGLIFSVDTSYKEVAAPRGDQVSHILQCDWLDNPSHSSEEIQELIRKNLIGVDAKVIGPWD